MPQDTVAPVTNKLQQLRGKIANTRPGRNALSIIDLVNKFTSFIGDPIENAGIPGGGADNALQAIIPAFEKLVKNKLLKKASNLFDEAGYFMDKSGDVYDLGNMYKAENPLTHPEVLAHAGYDEEKIFNKFPEIIDELGAMRVRRSPRILGIETTSKPSNAQLEQIQALLEANPKMEVALDLHNLAKPATDPLRYSGQHFTEGTKALDFINNFFTRKAPMTEMQKFRLRGDTF